MLLFEISKLMSKIHRLELVSFQCAVDIKCQNISFGAAEILPEKTF